MNTIVFLLILIGMYLLLTGIYMDKLAKVEKDKNIQHVFIPRSEYEEQFDAQQINKKIKHIYFNVYPNPSSRQ